MTRGREIVAGLSLTASLTLAASGCANNEPSEHKAFHIDTSTPYGKKLEEAAARIIQLADSSPSRYSDKPNYSLGFEVVTQGAGAIDYSVQTTTKKHNPGQAESIAVAQAGANQPNFEILFYANNDGTWNSYCYTNPGSSKAKTLAEENETEFISNSGKKSTRAHSSVLARTVLSDEISNLDSLIGAAEAETTTVPISPGCNVNIGS